MIFLDIKQYCQNNCNMFEADVEKQERTVKSSSHAPKTEYDSIVRCNHRDICERMRIQFSHPDGEDLK